MATPIPFLISAVRINIYSPAFFDVQSNIYREVKKAGIIVNKGVVGWKAKK